MSDRIDTDICVIGAGSGGLSVAAAAAAFGVPVVLVERGLMGGDCLNYGCVPSKAFLAAGKRAHHMRNARQFGIADVDPKVNFGRVNNHIRQVVAAIAPNDSVERFTGLGVRVIQGEGRFTSRRTLSAGGKEIRARRFVIATGSAPAVPPIKGISEVAYLTNETVFELRRRPTRLIVIGGGPIGMEIAQAFHRLGSDVIVLEAGTPLGREDPEAAITVLNELRKEGIDIRTGVRIVRVENIQNGVRVVVKSDGGQESLEASDLVVATGRRPNLDSLDLARAKVETSPRGVVVDAGLRTTNRRIYAIGDAAGGLQFTHMANYHAGLVIRNAVFRLPISVRTDHIPRVTFTDPELAHVGIDEASAREQGIGIRVLRWPYHENDRAQAERETEGFIKVITNRKGRVLGATIVGAHAGELINMWSLAVAERMKIDAFTRFVSPYPTLAEIGKRAAISYYTPSLRNPWLRRLIVFLRKFG
ncbi:MAG: FAD-dependent oxidoreductase [Rhodobiaceae bacterium]|nr:FAD-dependent oxidoreductase [Rhodobiaceae bacterium]MCC0055097.1 FAD-dependent oxidoreductase [Rhodobiaceae bacterium]